MKLASILPLVTAMTLGLAFAACDADTTAASATMCDPETPPAAAPYDDTKLVPQGFTKKSAEVNGVKINYVMGGKGTPVVLLHGWPQSWYEWHDIMPGLAAEHTVIAMDLRGIGGSTGPETGYEKQVLAEDVHQLMVGLGLGRFSLVGHDIGGMVAHAYGRLYPSELDHLVIIDVPVPGIAPWDTIKGIAWHFGFHEAKDQIAEELVSGHEEAYFRHFYNDFSFTGKGIGEERVKIFAAAYKAPESLRAGFELYRAFPADEAFTAAHASTPLDVPVLVIGGEKSLGPYLSYVANGLAAAGATKVTTQAISGSGHWVAEEQPEQLTERLLAFLQ